MDTKSLREEAGALLTLADEKIKEGDAEQADKMLEDAKVKMAKADSIDQTESKAKVLKGDFNKPLNTVPIASNDVAVYNPNDTTTRTKADYKPASWVKGLPAMAQPLWVQEKMGDNQKAEAKFQTETWEKWFKAPSEAMFFKNATLDVIRVASKDGYVPTLASATWAAIAEEAAISDQTPTVGQIPFSIEKSGGSIKVSRELLDDSAVNLPALLTQIFQESAGRFEDVGIISGNGTTQYAGIMGASPSDYTMANATSVVAADLIGIYYTLESQHRANASFIMKSAIAALVTSIAVTANGIHMIPSLTAAPSDTILGRPNVMTDVVSGLGATITATERIALFGDLKQYYIFDRIGFTIRRNDSLYMGNDQIGFFATRRGDGQLTLAGAFKMCRAAAS